MRDLSLLLEGLLQTNKGAVLKDIMNKNGEHHFQSQPLWYFAYFNGNIDTYKVR
jgi:hypothetical protein